MIKGRTAEFNEGLIKYILFYTMKCRYDSFDSMLNRKNNEFDNISHGDEINKLGSFIKRDSKRTSMMVLHHIKLNFHSKQ